MIQLISKCAELQSSALPLQQNNMKNSRRRLQVKELVAFNGTLYYKIRLHFNLHELKF